jgi:hypothetical protein
MQPVSKQLLGKRVPVEMRCTQQYSYYGNRGVLYAVCAEELSSRPVDQFSCQLIVQMSEVK